MGAGSNALSNAPERFVAIKDMLLAKTKVSKAKHQLIKGRKISKAAHTLIKATENSKGLGSGDSAVAIYGLRNAS